MPLVPSSSARIFHVSSFEVDASPRRTGLVSSESYPGGRLIPYSSKSSRASDANVMVGNVLVEVNEGGCNPAVMRRTVRRGLTRKGCSRLAARERQG